MKDNAFQRRDMERMLLSGKKLTTSQMMKMYGVGQYQNTLTQEQLECLEKMAVTCGSEERKIVLSIIHEFGPYCGSFT